MRKLAHKRFLAQTGSLLACCAGFTAATKTGLVVPFMFCHGCPLASVACPIGALQHFTAVRRFPFLVLGTLGIAFLLLGRAACGWLCPFGAFQDLLAWASGRGTRGRPADAAVPRLDAWARRGKAIVLASTLILAYLLASTTFCWLCPVGALFAAIPYRLAMPSARMGAFFYVHLVVLAAVAIWAMRTPRAWCRYLCPLGALAGQANRLSLARLELDETRCTGCLACLAACPMGIRSLEGLGGSECILCGRCVETCRTGALKLAVG